MELRISKRPKKNCGDADISHSAAHSWPDVLSMLGYDVESAPEDSESVQPPVFSGFVVFPGFKLVVDVRIDYDPNLIVDHIDGRPKDLGAYTHRFRLFLYTEPEALDDDPQGRANEILNVITNLSQEGPAPSSRGPTTPREP
jgi:hypothetical protein